MNNHNLDFRTMDLSRNADAAVAFRRDSYVCSFGSDEAFGDVEIYLAWLRDRVARQPAGHVHVWQGSTIIGQLEMLIQETSPVRGYVNLFYLVPEARGRGLGAALHQYFLQFMQAGGACVARLAHALTTRQISARRRQSVAVARCDRARRAAPVLPRRSRYRLRSASHAGR